MVKSVYLLEKSKNIVLEENEGYYDEERMVNVIFKNGKEIPVISTDKILIAETKSFSRLGDDDDE